MMKPNLYQRAALTRDLPEEILLKDDLAWLLDYVAHTVGGGDGVVFELFNAAVDSTHIVTVPASLIFGTDRMR
jgi:hypothetical protein